MTKVEQKISLMPLAKATQNLVLSDTNLITGYVTRITKAEGTRKINAEYINEFKDCTGCFFIKYEMTLITPQGDKSIQVYVNNALYTFSNLENNPFRLVTLRACSTNLNKLVFVLVGMHSIYDSSEELAKFKGVHEKALQVTPQDAVNMILNIACVYNKHQEAKPETKLADLEKAVRSAKLTKTQIDTMRQTSADKLNKYLGKGSNSTTSSLEDFASFFN